MAGRSFEGTDVSGAIEAIGGIMQTISQRKIENERLQLERDRVGMLRMSEARLRDESLLRQEGLRLELDKQRRLETSARIAAENLGVGSPDVFEAESRLRQQQYRTQAMADEAMRTRSLFEQEQARRIGEARGQLVGRGEAVSAGATLASMTERLGELSGTKEARVEQSADAGKMAAREMLQGIGLSPDLVDFFSPGVIAQMVNVEPGEMEFKKADAALKSEVTKVSSSLTDLEATPEGIKETLKDEVFDEQTLKTIEEHRRAILDIINTADPAHKRQLAESVGGSLETLRKAERKAHVDIRRRKFEEAKEPSFSLPTM